MVWRLEYYEQEDGNQPAEDFADKMRKAPSKSKLWGKLTRYAISLTRLGQDLGAKYVRPCKGYGGLWTLSVTSDNGQTADAFFGFSGRRIVLLDGCVRKKGNPIPKSRLTTAFSYWEDYQRSNRVSPEK